MIHRTPHWLRACTVGLTLTLGSAAGFGQSNGTPGEPSTALELFNFSNAMYRDGQLLDAQEALLRVDFYQLTPAQRDDYRRLSSQIESDLKNLTEVELLKLKADFAMRNENLRSALVHLDELDARAGALSPADRAVASAMRAEVAAMQAALAPQIPQLLNDAAAALQARDYETAKAGFEAVERSGVELSAGQQRSLMEGLSTVYELEASRGGRAIPAEPISLAMLSSGTNTGAATGRGVTVQATQPESQPTPPPQAEPMAQPQPQPQPSAVNPDDIVRQAQQAEIEQLLRQADSLLAQNQYAAALVRYQRVLSLDPGNQEAIQGELEAQAFLNQPGNLAQAELIDLEVQRQALVAEFNNFLEQAGRELAEGDFPAAETLVARARSRVADDRRLLSVDQYNALLTEADAVYSQIQQARQAADAAARDAQARELSERRAEEQRRIERQKQQEIIDKLINIRRLQQAQRYEEALQECETLLVLDRGNPSAIVLRDVIRELLIYRQFSELQYQGNLREAEHSINLQGQQQIPVDIVEYPEDWPVITLRRSDALGYLETDADRQVWSALASKGVGVEFADTALAEAVRWVGEMAGVNVDVDWRSLELAGINRETPINLKLNENISLETVLKRVLSQLGEDEYDRPAYAVADGILTISTREQLQRNTVTHVYDLHDLLINVPNFTDAPDFDLDAILDRTSARERADRLFGETPSSTADYDRDRLSREQMVDRLRDVITAHIDPKSWDVNGGDVSSIDELNGNFIITTTVRNHKEIGNLLGKLREIRSLQISVESRFLVVADNFFEEIGFDLDIYWGGSTYQTNKGEDPNLLPSDIFRDPTTFEQQEFPQRQYFSLFEIVPATDDQGNPVFDANRRQLVDQLIPEAGVFQRGRDTWSPWALQQDTLGMTEALFGADANSFAGQALGRSSALSFAITYLDEVQVDLLIRATQADRRNVSLTAPKLTFFNGQRSYVQVTTSRFFVSDLTPVVGTSSAGFDPELSTLREGVVLDVEGTVSADRRYVTLTVATSLSNIVDIQTTPVPIVVGGDVLVSDEPNPVLSQNAFIERPIIQVSSVNSTVTVPDRGTIMLGGQTIRTDIEIETGVPVLSKIPIINRFFTNRLFTIEESTLLVLIKPTIIIQQENEERLFPGLLDQVQSTGSGYYGF